MTDAIRSEGLTKSYDDTLAVVELDLSVAEGEIFGLVGPDGAGKSTTIRMLTTILAPDAGSASVLGYDIAKQKGKIRGNLGYMAQQFNLYAEMTVAENLDFFADIYGVRGSERSKRMSELLEFSRLGPFLNRPAGQLSGGMKQKLALACNLVHTPRLLFLDEPTTGVDPVSRREFWRILSELHAGGTTLFIATPYMDEAERCDRVGFIDGGRLSLAASPAQIIADVSRESLEVRGTPLREACRILGELPGIATVDMFGDRLRAVLSDTELTALDVERVLREHGIDVDSVRPSAATMESAFVELLRRGAR